MAFNLLAELEARRQVIEENEAKKQIVADLEEQLAVAKAEVRSDDEIADLHDDVEKITEFCYRLGLLERPVEAVVEETVPETAVIEPIV